MPRQLPANLLILEKQLILLQPVPIEEWGIIVGIIMIID
jgi:hypothetical protein